MTQANWLEQAGLALDVLVRSAPDSAEARRARTVRLIWADGRERPTGIEPEFSA
jgi:hypothetical protein